MMAGIETGIFRLFWSVARLMVFLILAYTILMSKFV
jgi:hypothetical protein